jgi:hypothetical protein
MFVWADHAELMATERCIDRRWTEQTIQKPEQLERDSSHPERMRTFRRIEDNAWRWLREVYEVATFQTRIITVVFDRKAGRFG